MTTTNRDGEVNVGETVLFSKYSGNEITLDGTEFLVIEINVENCEEKPVLLRNIVCR
jgi:co-chaperonin GroES (HSP10)